MIRAQVIVRPRKSIFDPQGDAVCRAIQHLGEDRATRYLRKFYPWYIDRMGGDKALQAAAQAQAVFEQTGAAAVLLARGSLGNPWLFEQLLGVRVDEPSRAEILAEIDWVLDSAVEHLGVERASRYLRKFYPWYVDRLGAGKPLQDGLQRAETIGAARALLHES